VRRGIACCVAGYSWVLCARCLRAKVGRAESDARSRRAGCCWAKNTSRRGRDLGETVRRTKGEIGIGWERGARLAMEDGAADGGARELEG
jgi:hypothetical protein